MFPVITPITYKYANIRQHCHHPTYNERENIENIIRAVFALKHGFHILVIEDGSPDGTAAIVKTLQQEFPERLFMVERKGKLGLGTAT